MGGRRDAGIFDASRHLETFALAGLQAGDLRIDLFAPAAEDPEIGLDPVRVELKPAHVQADLGNARDWENGKTWTSSVRAPSSRAGSPSSARVCLFFL
jgi:hypothetical protein